jgi:uncharacterized membrane protein
VDRSRLEAFSDGVFAVAITLLALNLAVAGPGHGTLGHQLTTRWPAFAAYAVSFLTIGIIWVNHHALFKSFAAVDRVLVFLNLTVLFFVVLIPFASSTFAAYLRSGGADAHLAAALFELVFLGMGLSFFAVFWWPVRQGLLHVPLSRREASAAVVRFGIGTAGYAVAIGVAFVSAGAALAISALVALYYVFERTPAPSEARGAAPGEQT